MYHSTLRGSRGAFRPRSLFLFGHILRIHAGWPWSLWRMDCNLLIWIHACWPWSLRRLDCNPETWIGPSLLALVPSALIKCARLALSITPCNEVFHPSQRTRRYAKEVWIVEKIVNVDQGRSNTMLEC